MSWKSRINTYPLFVSLIFALRFEKDYSILVSVRFNWNSMWDFLGMSGRVNDGAKIWPASSNLVSSTRNTESASPLARANSIHVSPGPRRGSSKLQPTSVKKSKSSMELFNLWKLYNAITRNEDPRNNRKWCAPIAPQSLHLPCAIIRLLCNHQVPVQVFNLKTLNQMFNLKTLNQMFNLKALNFKVWTKCLLPHPGSQLISLITYKARPSKGLGSS